MDELEALRAETSHLPSGVSWPESFEEIYKLALPGARKPREFDFIAQLGADAPHYNYPLRQVGEANYKILDGAEAIGDIALNQAIREAYPGALYLHLRKPMKVREWRATTFDRSIRIERARSPVMTRPILRKRLNVSIDQVDVVEGRILSCPTGVIAEINLQVNESVEGFSIAGRANLYRDLRATDRRMTRKQRDFRTTGVVIQIDEPWFSGSGGPAHLREAVAEALKQLLIREMSISPNDIDSASTHIAVYAAGAPHRATNVVVIYDSIYGGLRLTEPLFTNFSGFIAQLGRAAEIAGNDAYVSEETAELLSAWASTLSPGVAMIRGDLSPRDGEILIYAPGSEVAVMINGVISDRVLISPQMFSFGDTEMLMYKYDNGGRGDAWVPHEQVQATGHDWRMAFWNPTTGEIRSADEDEGAF